jgi:hypothetical protein
MKIFGYADDGLPIEEIDPSKLAEVTVNATPKELRSIAAFLPYSADLMEQMGSRFGHVHR